MNEILLEVRNLKKSFKEIEAVRGISFQVHKSQCFGLLGPNGAGKSTTMEMVECVSTPTGGEILFNGESIFDNPLLREKMGVQFQETALPPLLSVRESIELFQSFYQNTRDMNELIQRCQLGEFIDRMHSKISGGQRQRLLLAMALCQKPELLMLDEPTTGLDPQARRHIWDIIEEVKESGTSIVLTTHYMEEAAQLCDEIAIIDHGRFIAQGSPRKLLDEHCRTKVIQIDSNAIASHKNFEFCTKTVERGELFEIHTDSLEKTVAELLEKKISLESMNVRQSNLEDLFLDLTGRQLRS